MPKEAKQPKPESVKGKLKEYTDRPDVLAQATPPSSKRR